MRWSEYSEDMMISKLRITAAALAGVVALAGCHDRREGVTTPFGEGVAQWGKKLPYDNWQFNFFYPKNLPAVVTLVIVEDGEIGETVYRRLDPTEPSQSSVEKWSRVIGGFPADFYIGKALPVSMHFCWDSVIDKKPYETLIWFDRETWEQMTTRYADNIYPDKPFWRRNMLIGLAPGGIVRVWLDNQGDPAVLQRGARISTVSGDQRMMCKNIRSRINFNYSVPDGYDQFIKDFIKGKTYPYGNW
ncbi:DUF2931 family protein [Brenneria populi]|uniref:DUF2931 family protein n=1 Tax=Brenneria populi TaxID=1505588 RepID=A0ABU6JL54_9GAMM|nr:DUF2931 family protein [Brenneria populi Li et al. 2015]